MPRDCFHPMSFGAEAEVECVMNSPFAGRPRRMTDDAFADLVRWIEADDVLLREMEKGKMAGVLCVRRKNGRTGYLAAFSGQILGRNSYEGFVPPVSDYLNDNAYYAEESEEIMRLSRRIGEEEGGDTLRRIREEAARIEAEERRIVGEKAASNAEAKRRRDEYRKTHIINSEEEDALRRESATQKSELRRMKKEAEERIAEARRRTEEAEGRIGAMREERARRSEALQTRIFRDFKFRNGMGEEKDMVEIFGGMPPSGSGECCAPRLLDYALRHGMKPMAIGEYWIGESPKGKVRHHGTYYHACRGKCRPILEFVLQGVRVEEAAKVAAQEEECIRTLYRDESIMVISKPSGMASVRGKETVWSVEEWAEGVLGNGCPHIVHRLDQDTSGLMILARTKEAHKELQRQFEQRKVRKRYVAVVGGEVSEDEGLIDLPLMPDLQNRPMQMVSREWGLSAVTRYAVSERGEGTCRLDLYPLMGRTHQLRVHLASAEGLGCPIIGDRLYSDKSGDGRLLLHAEEITFRHPVTNKLLTFTDKAPF